MTVRIHVERELCVGHGRCATVAPEVFTLDDSGYNTIDGDHEVDDALERAARLGALNCPEGCISVERI